MNRRTKAGIDLADSIIELCHIMYDKSRAKVVVRAIVDRLNERISEYDKSNINRMNIMDYIRREKGKWDTKKIRRRKGVE